MASENAKRDQNNVPTLLAASSTDGVSTVRLYADPTSHRLLVNSTGGGGSLTVTDEITTVPNVTTIDFLSNVTVTDEGAGTAGVQLNPGGGDGNVQFNFSGSFAGSNGLTWDTGAQILNANRVITQFQTDFTSGAASLVTTGIVQIGDSFNLVSGAGVPDAEFAQGAYLTGGIWTATNDNPSKIVMYDGSLFLSTGFGTGIGNEPVWTNVLNMDGPDKRIGINNSGAPLHDLDVWGDFRATGRTFDSSDSAGSSGQVLTSTSTATAWASPLSLGIPKVVASADLLAQTAAVSSVTTVTSPNDGVNHTYSVGAYASITAISAGTLTVQYSFTDENNTARTLSFFAMGLTSAGITTTGFDSFPPGTIRCKPNTAVTVKTTFTGVSITYDVGGYITQIS